MIFDPLHVVLPPGLRELWDATSGLVLAEDLEYGQWGLIIWSPDQAFVRHRRYVSERPAEYRSGDLVIGEFLGDSDLVLVRCDSSSSDFGSILIALPIDRREDWCRAAPSIEEFLNGFINTGGTKYWEP